MNETVEGTNHNGKHIKSKRYNKPETRNNKF